MRFITELRTKYLFNQTYANILLHIYWFQFINLQILNQFNNNQSQIWINNSINFPQKFTNLLTGTQTQLIIFAFHIFLLIFLTIYLLEQKLIKYKCVPNHIINVFRSSVAYSFKLYPFLLSIYILYTCLNSFKSNNDLLTLILSILNLIMSISLVFFHIFVHITLRFQQNDYIMNRKIDLLTQSMCMLVIVEIVYLDEIYIIMTNFGLCILIIFESISFFNYQNMKKISVFYCGVIFYINLQLLIQLIINYQLQLIQLIILEIGSFILSYIFMNALNRYYLKNINIKYTSPIELERLIRQFYYAFKERKSSNKKKQLLSIFYSVIVQHFTLCTKISCKCKRKAMQKKSFWQNKDQEIFIYQNLRLLENLEMNFSNNYELRLLIIYFYLEIAKEPIKAYYEIMKLKREKIPLKVHSQLLTMIEATKICFSKIFKKNKVQNQELQLSKLLEYEQNIQWLNKSIEEAINLNINFLMLFTYSSLKICIIEEKAKIIEELKLKIEEKIEELITNYTESISLNLFIFVFYRYIQFYRSRQAQFQKIKNQEMMKKRIFQKNQINIFSQEHGTIYIDLIQERGKIQKITKTIYESFGYNKQQMVQANVDNFMPDLYSKYHDKFLCNFIQRGEITLLKYKERVVFAKSKRHFIFPINVRLKVQNLDPQKFGASALITKLKTNLDYILFNEKGKIQQISEPLYKKVFEQFFADQVNKISKCNILKLIPNLNILIQQQTSLKNSDSIMIIPNQGQYFVKFRFHSNIENENTNESFQSKLQKNSFDNCASKLSIDEKKDERNLETFKNFILNINIFKLKGFKITYKISTLSTHYFKLKLLQISSIKQVPQEKQFFTYIINQFKNIAQFYQINESYLPVLNRIHHYQKMIKKFPLQTLTKLNKLQDLQNQLQSLPTSMSFLNPNDSKVQLQYQASMDQEKKIDLQSQQDILSLESNQIEEQNGVRLRGNSEQSSVIGDQENQNKKQLIKQAFNSTNHGIPFSILIFNIISFILLIIICLVTFFISYYFIINQKNSCNGNNFIVNLTQSLEFFEAFIQIQKYYLINNNTYNESRNIYNQNNKFIDLYKSMSQQTLNLSYNDHSSAQYLQNITLFDPVTNSNFTINLVVLIQYLTVEFLNQPIYAIKLLEYNQNLIENTLEHAIDQAFLLRKQLSKTFRVNALINFLLAQSVLIIILFVSIPIYIFFRGRKEFLLSLLSYFNIKQIKKSITTLKLLSQFFNIPDEATRTNRIYNQLTEKKKINPKFDDKFTNSLIEQSDKHNLESQKLKTPKLSFIGTEDNKRKYIIMLIIMLLLFSIYPSSIYAFTYINQTYVENTIDLEQKLNDFQKQIPIVISLYLTNINKELKNHSILKLNNTVLDQDYYELLDYLSQNKFHSNLNEQSIYNMLKQNMCEMLNKKQIDNNYCQSIYNGLFKKGYFYTTMTLKNKFDYFVLNQTNDSSKIKNWTTQNQIADLFQLINFVRLISIELENSIIITNNSFFVNYLNFLIIIAVCLLFLSLIAFIYIKEWFLKQLVNIIKSAQKIFLNFQINILTENTYLTSYFNSKVKAKI